MIHILQHFTVANNTKKEIHFLQNKILNAFFWLYALLLAIIITIDYIIDGFSIISPLHYIYVIMVTAFIIMYIIKGKLNYNIKAYSLLSIACIICAASIYLYGVLSHSFILSIVLVLFAFSLCNKKIGIITSIMALINTELEKSNNLLNEERERSQAADRLKTAFLANISHEIRTPLNAIVGFSNLLNNDSFSASEKKAYTTIIQASTNQLLDIISDIVNISKIESEQYQLTPTDFEINEFISDLANKYTNEISLKKDDNISFIVISNINSPKYIFADIECIKTIIGKIIDNAIKFTHKGSIKVVFSIDTHNNLIILVKDTGIGIDKSKQAEIFYLFSQVESTENRTYGGNGLGLSISKGLVNLLKGKIALESQINVGSEFTISIPLQFSNITEYKTIASKAKSVK